MERSDFSSSLLAAELALLACGLEFAVACGGDLGLPGRQYEDLVQASVINMPWESPDLDQLGLAAGPLLPKSFVEHGRLR